MRIDAGRPWLPLRLRASASAAEAAPGAGQPARFVPATQDEDTIAAIVTGALLTRPGRAGAAGTAGQRQRLPLVSLLLQAVLLLVGPACLHRASSEVRPR